MRVESDTIDMWIYASQVGGEDQAAAPCRVRFLYDTRDPYAVSVEFGGTTWVKTVCWVFSRELFFQAWNASDEQPRGLGDVVLWQRRNGPGGHEFHIKLTSPDGWLWGSVQSNHLLQFVAKMVSAVPPGREGECLDMDTEIVKLLNRGSRHDTGHMDI